MVGPNNIGESGLKTGISLNDDIADAPENDTDVTETADAVDDKIPETGTEEKIPGEKPPDKEVDDKDESEGEDEKSAPEDKEAKEEYVDWDEWRQQYELPEEIKTAEDMATALQAMLKEKGQPSATEREIDALLREHGISGGLQGLKEKLTAKPGDQKATEKPADDDPYSRGELKPTSAMKLVTDLITDGKIEAEDIPFWKHNASIMDRAIGPVYENQDALYGGMQFVASQLKGLMNRAERAEKWIRDSQYREYSDFLGKDISPMKREELDKALQVPGIENYVQAHAYLAGKDPKNLLAWARVAQAGAQQKAIKKLRMGGIPARGAGAGSDTDNLKAYMMSDGKTVNKTAMLKLGRENPAKYNRIMKQIEELAEAELHR